MSHTRNNELALKRSGVLQNEPILIETLTAHGLHRADSRFAHVLGQSALEYFILERKQLTVNI